ncbi:MAG: P1 family peptidase [Oscillospiraceae bacterium]|nr:P1 family peptidase [Oscillospiraceae bacterium]
MKEISIAEIEGFRIGHAQDRGAATGCTVVICERGAVTGVDVRGGSPGTRDTDALNPVNNRQEVHAVLLAGGSSFGLDAAGGVMRYLEERGIGRDVQVTKVPNVCGAILFDLKCGGHKVRPDARMGYLACEHASAGSPGQGSVGAGTGATVGKILGRKFAMKGGVGSAAYEVGALRVGAVMAVNCVGDVYDGESGRLIAGVRGADGRTLLGSENVILGNYQNRADVFSGKAAEIYSAGRRDLMNGNTVIGCVITNAKLEKVQAAKLSSISQNGIARAVRPAHSMFDGDTIFAMCSGEVRASFDAVGILAAKAVERAIVSAILHADGLAGYPSFRELEKIVL